MIWIYALAGVFPWNIVGGVWLLKHQRQLPCLFKDEDGWVSYLCLCMLTPLIFFTFANNIIYPYVFPFLPPFALFFSEIWHRWTQRCHPSKWILVLTTLAGIFFLLITALFVVKPDWIGKTQKPIIELWSNQYPKAGSYLVYWGSKTDFSAQFYAAGKVTSIQSKNGLCRLLANNATNYLVVNSRLIEEIPKDLLSKCTLVKTIRYSGDKMFLCSASSCS